MHRFCRAIFIPVLSLLAFSVSATSQLGADRARTSTPVRLKGNVHPLARPQFDAGAVPDATPTERLLLVLKRTPTQEQALQRFLQETHRPDGWSYHQWLTPDEFGKRFGPSQTDIEAASVWLQSHGFAVEPPSRGRTILEFSGTAGQIRDAFGTELHTYNINGEQHVANNRDPQIPASLAHVVAGIATLNDFRPKPFASLLGKARLDSSTHRLTPDWTFPSDNLFMPLAPGDFALQYNVTPLHKAGVRGQGMTIGIIGASNIDPTVVDTFRSFYGLPENPVEVVVDGLDPGLNSAMVESYLDVEVAAAVAPEAKIKLYTSAGTTLQDGLSLAAIRAVEENQATVLSVSYGLCEQSLGSAGNLFWASLWQQAAAQGQTVLVASGDGGAAGCDDFNNDSPALYGIAVNGFASTPWNVSVGGTDLYYTSYNGTGSAQQKELAKYWNLTPTIYPTTSMLQRVPEQPWNRAFGLDLWNGGIYQYPTIVGGSGGPSHCVAGTDSTDGTFATCTGGYAKPSWQSGAHIPQDGVRDQPDVSLFAAAGENGTAYPICILRGECDIHDGSLMISIAGGTSASTPAMAGIMALVNQKYGPQGQANFTLYPLAAQHGSAFHDVAVGSNVVPCSAGTPDCSLSTQNDNTAGQYVLGYYAGTGYDMATGLGSVDANALVTNWNALTFASSTTTLQLASTTFQHGTPVNVTVGVSGAGGTPSGDVALITDGKQGIGVIPLSSGAGAATFAELPGGTYQLRARYSGDSLFAASTSAPVSIHITPENSALTLFGSYYNRSLGTYGDLSNGATYVYGTEIAAEALATSNLGNAGSGTATGTVTFTDVLDGVSHTSGALPVGSQGIAVWDTNGFAAGAHTLTAHYSGDVSYNASTSTSLSFTVTKATPIMYLTPSSSQVGLGKGVLITAIARVYGAGSAPTGTVTFRSGDTVLGTATLVTSPTYMSVTGVATLSVNSLPLGDNTITASYAGDANFNVTDASPTSVTVMQPVSVTLAVTPSSGTLAQSYEAKASVTGASGQPAPTGYVSFSASRCSFWTGGGFLQDGVATFQFDGSSFCEGDVNIIADYAGDTVYASESVASTVTMSKPFSLTADSALSVTAGATSGNSSNITITPLAGFTGTVYLRCTIAYYPSSAQRLPTCSVPASMAVSGNSTVSAKMTIVSAANTSAASHPAILPFGFAGGGTVFAICCLGLKGARRRRVIVRALLVGAALLLISCGGGGSSAPPPQKPIQQGTTPGSYKFLLEGSFTQQFGYSQPQLVTVDVTIH